MTLCQREGRHCIVSMVFSGGALFGIFGKYTNRFGRDPVVLLGMLLHFVAFLLCYYNLPNDAINNDVSIASSFGTLFNPSK